MPTDNTVDPRVELLLERKIAALHRELSLELKEGVAELKAMIGRQTDQGHDLVLSSEKALQRHRDLEATILRLESLVRGGGSDALTTRVDDLHARLRKVETEGESCPVATPHRPSAAPSRASTSGQELVHVTLAGIDSRTKVIVAAVTLGFPVVLEVVRWLVSRA